MTGDDLLGRIKKLETQVGILRRDTTLIPGKKIPTFGDATTLWERVSAMEFAIASLSDAFGMDSLETERRLGALEGKLPDAS